MTETTTTTEERTEAYPDVGKPCRAGTATERPCWRPATEADIGETEPTLCSLHVQLRRRDKDLDRAEERARNALRLWDDAL